MEALVEQLGNLTVLEMLALVKELETKWDISSKPIVEIRPAGYETETPAVEEKTTFDIELSAVGANKIAVIKLIREITQLALLEAKKLSEGLPAKIIGDISESQAKELQKKFEEIGAKIEIK